MLLNLGDVAVPGELVRRFLRRRTLHPFLHRAGELTLYSNTTLKCATNTAVVEKELTLVRFQLPQAERGGRAATSSENAPPAGSSFPHNVRK